LEWKWRKERREELKEAEMKTNRRAKEVKEIMSIFI